MASKSSTQESKTEGTGEISSVTVLAPVKSITCPIAKRIHITYTDQNTCGWSPSAVIDIRVCCDENDREFQIIYGTHSGSCEIHSHKEACNRPESRYQMRSRKIEGPDLCEIVIHSKNKFEYENELKVDTDSLARIVREKILSENIAISTITQWNALVKCHYMPPNKLGGFSTARKENGTIIEYRDETCEILSASFKRTQGLEGSFMCEIQKAIPGCGRVTMRY